jgi:hypothetical protein
VQLARLQHLPMIDRALVLHTKCPSKPHPPRLLHINTHSHKPHCNTLTKLKKISGPEHRYHCTLLPSRGALTDPPGTNTFQVLESDSLHLSELNAMQMHPSPTLMLLALASIPWHCLSPIMVCARPDLSCMVPQPRAVGMACVTGSTIRIT